MMLANQARHTSSARSKNKVLPFWERCSARSGDMFTASWSYLPSWARMRPPAFATNASLDWHLSEISTTLTLLSVTEITTVVITNNITFYCVVSRVHIYFSDTFLHFLISIPTG